MKVDLRTVLRVIMPACALARLLLSPFDDVPSLFAGNATIPVANRANGPQSRELLEFLAQFDDGSGRWIDFEMLRTLAPHKKKDSSDE